MTAEAVAEVFETHRPRLFAVAYRMLGSAGDAEDAVQDTYLRWAGAESAAIVTPAAWLTTVLTRICLNRLTSARATREQYVGTWLPEPVATALPGPADVVEQRDALSFGLLVLLERLTPSERAVFVLREAFAHTHHEIAEMIGISESASQQLLRRAKVRLEAAQSNTQARFTASDAESQRLVGSFLAAAQRGDHDELVRMLSADVTAWADGGGTVPAARRPIRGVDHFVRYVMATLGRLREIPALDVQLSMLEVNGAPAVVATGGGRLMLVAIIEVEGGRITSMRSVMSPEKLAFMARQLGHTTVDAETVATLIALWRQRTPEQGA
ncbi:RNA polymerase sigma factor SigJ [Pseudonocardia sp. TRM90224]|uniref:RNA polymerase sigma factor SigJ n=1 Tax=Pseudonocardia sp. TRM90224 TaxID=2812678 RepID=UPI001E49BEBA|nr:RNA polymerase sigma factor SigJ [Pseudonocardia sp. TRM90224]